MKILEIMAEIIKIQSELKTIWDHEKLTDADIQRIDDINKQLETLKLDQYLICVKDSPRRNRFKLILKDKRK